MKEKKKTVNLYVVIDAEKGNTDPVTVTATRDEAIAGLERYLFVKYYDHFKIWAPLHGHPLDSFDVSLGQQTDVWEEYVSLVVAPEIEQYELDTGEPLYSIITVAYSKELLATVLRQFMGCIPLGCPYDTEEEISSFSHYLAEKAAYNEMRKSNPGAFTSEEDKQQAEEMKFTKLETNLSSMLEDLDNLHPEIKETGNIDVEAASSPRNLN